ncbi:MAG: MFS transporter [Cytophagales bacterium CG12_big_fil_rev_8_21_14_0_65_40_12]|nr:MAG: MFS transporter [Cytophagales bacterium CG12_big_fil_rev_8_21_14_0_65_40_12]PIW04956.1 MAG: MFS transporter [Cytophagales bacterium CG17_big_fil_post_rev_8_21_14_2_50_40_13]
MQLKNQKLAKVTILFCSMMTVMAGATIAPSLPEMTKAFPGNPSAETLVKLVLTIPGLFIAITAPFSGWIIDKFGRIKLLVAMLLLYAIAGTSGLYLNTLGAIIVGRAFLGIAVGGIMTTAVALIGDYFEGNERQKFLGTQAGIMALSGTIFISSGGFLADISWRYPFLIYGLAALAIPMVLIYLKEPDSSGRKLEKDEVKEKIPKLAWTIYLISFLGMAVFYMMPVQIPFLIQEIDNVGNMATGIALSASMLFAASMSFSYQKFKNRLTHYQIYGISFLIMGLGYMAVSFATSYAWVYPGLLLAGLGSGLVMPNSNLCLVTLASPKVRGRVLGLLTTFIFLGQFASPLMFQPIINLSSIRGGFHYLSMALIVFSIIALIRNRRLIRS